MDDLAIPSLSPSGCQMALNVVAHVITMLDMTINADKSYYVVFNNLDEVEECVLEVNGVRL